MEQEMQPTRGFVHFFEKWLMGRFRYKPLDSAITGKNFQLYIDEALGTEVDTYRLAEKNQGFRFELEQLISLCEGVENIQPHTYVLDSESNKGLHKIKRQHPDISSEQIQRIRLLRERCVRILEEQRPKQRSSTSPVVS